MGEKFFAWPLGGDYVCESCGPTNNEVILEQLDVSEWSLSCVLGCYGFDSVCFDEPHWVEKVEDIISAIVSYPNFSEQDEKDLREKIERIKGEYE
jgi:hypothetical protein